MPHWLPAVLFGLAIAGFGLVMLRHNRRAWLSVNRDVELNPFDRIHLQDRYARRIQISGMLVTIGLLIGIGDVFVWDFGPAPAAVYWIAVILLGCWTALLALGDLTSVRAHSQVVRKRLEKQRMELEQELLQMRHQSSNQGDLTS